MGKPLGTANPTIGARRQGAAAWRRRIMRVLLLLLIMLAGASTPAAEVGLPAEVVAGAQDHPLLPGDETALVIEQTTLDLDRIGLPAAPLLPTDRRDGRNNQVFAAADTRSLEGRI